MGVSPRSGAGGHRAPGPYIWRLSLETWVWSSASHAFFLFHLLVVVPWKIRRKRSGDCAVHAELARGGGGEICAVNVLEQVYFQAENCVSCR